MIRAPDAELRSGIKSQWPRFRISVGTKDVLPTILKSLANHVRYDYVAGFYPSSSGGRKRHKIEVVLRSKNRGEIVGGFRALVH